MVAKTYDQDLDADLWKDGFFGKRVTRYLCLSKTEGPEGFVIDSLCIINDKDPPPNGYILLSKTYGSGTVFHTFFVIAVVSTLKTKEIIESVLIFFFFRAKSLAETSAMLQAERKEFRLPCHHRHHRPEQSQEGSRRLYHGGRSERPIDLLQIGPCFIIVCARNETSAEPGAGSSSGQFATDNTFLRSPVAKQLRALSQQAN